jgi:phenylacetyl-CoA:acceptor oxidoreductase subunit 1
VDIKEEFCIGCGACIVACPYQVRTISYQDKIRLESTADVQMESMPEPDRIGLCTKCNFCLPRVEAGLAKGLNPGSDPEASPLCVNFCIANALFFGDLDNPKSTVYCLVRENKTARLQERLQTKPLVYYIMC